MIREWMLPGLLATGPVTGPIMAVQDGLVNFFAIKGPTGLLCVDAGWRLLSVQSGLASLGFDPGDVKALFLTHMHWDHARCHGDYPNARVFAAAADPTPGVTQLHDGQVTTAGGLSVRVIATPGHTPDSVSYVIDGRYLFTGDALRLRQGKVAPFPTKFNHDQAATKDSIRRLASLTGIEWLITAHTGGTSDVATAFDDWRQSGPQAAIKDEDWL